MQPQARLPLGMSADDALAGWLATRTKGFAAGVAVLGTGVACGVAALGYQLWRGPGEAGINRPVYWGLYIVQFVFLMGLSQGGILASAVLRLTGSEWRRPLTRAAEALTLLALLAGPTMILADLGRPALFYRVLTDGNPASPLFWDMASMAIFQALAVVYLYLPLLPDVALLRDRGIRPRWLYRSLAAGYTATGLAEARLRTSVRRLAWVIVPVAVVEHSVVAWIFASTLNPIWGDVLLVPQFVLAAFASGIAAMVVVLAAVRRAYGLQEWLTAAHFQKLGRFLLALDLGWLAIVAAEASRAYLKHAPAEMAVMRTWWSGGFAVATVAVVVLGCVIPVTLLAVRRVRTIQAIVVASISILAGTWLERFLIIIPSLTRPRLGASWIGYTPTLVEIAACLGALCLLGLLFLVFCRFLPVLSVWECRDTGAQISSHSGIQ